MSPKRSTVSPVSAVIEDDDSELLSDYGPLDPQLSLHEMLQEKGEKGTINAVKMTERVPGRRSTADVLTSRRGRRILQAAKLHLSEEGKNSAAEDLQAFIYSAWCHASFPHREPSDPNEAWLVQTDYVTLRVEPGTYTDEQGVSKSVGLPYGSYARLLLIDWSSQAYLSNSREIDLGHNLGATMDRLGISKGGKSRARLLEQAERLARCRLTFDIRSPIKNGKGSGLINQTLVDMAYYNEANRGGRFVEKVRISELFFEQLRKNPVSINPESIRMIRNSPMAIDIYCWLAFRLPYIEKDTNISWSALKAQFGTSFMAMRNFKTQFSECLTLAKGVYIGAKADLKDFGIVLQHSNPPVKAALPAKKKVS